MDANHSAANELFADTGYSVCVAYGNDINKFSLFFFKKHWCLKSERYFLFDSIQFHLILLMRLPKSFWGFM